MRTIDKTYLLELYAIHDKLACAIVALGSTLIHGGARDLVDLLNQADDLADQLETKFAEALTLEERGEKEDF